IQLGTDPILVGATDEQKEKWLGAIAVGPKTKCQYYYDGFSGFINGTDYYFITIKSEWVNRTWRKAICHAFNYTYLTDEIMEDTVSKAHSLVPPGFPAYNSSVLGGRYDIPYARQLMQKMGYGYTGSVPWDIGSQIGDRFFPGTDEALWTAAEFIPDVGNFTNNDWRFYHKQGSHFSELLIQRFMDDMDLIGIKVEPVVWTWDEFIPLDEWLMALRTCPFLWASYTPNYIDTFNQIYYMVNPGLLLYVHEIYDAEIDNLLKTTVEEVDSSQRNENYKKLQYLIHDKNYYHMPLFYRKVFSVHRDFLEGFPYNCMEYLYWYPTYRE
ncbi:MAG: ABC transporter substrate-binding protein, partial [Candidatus Thorarchaeota archaeon]